MVPASRGISSRLVGPTQGADEFRASGLKSRIESRSTGIRLIEKPVGDLDDYEFDDFEDSEEGSDLGLEEIGSPLNYLHARRERVTRSRF